MTNGIGRAHVSRRRLLGWTTLLGTAAIVPGVRAFEPWAAAAQEGDWSAPPDVARAKEQAKDYVTYGMPDDWANYGEVLRLFAAKHGFELKHTDTDMSSLEEITKYDAEKSNSSAITSDIGIIYGPIAEERGVVPPYLPPNAERLPAGLKAATGGWVATFVGVPAFVVNADVLDNVPRTWDDLLKPEYKGKVAFGDPRTSGTGGTTFIAWSYAHGGDVENMAPGVEFARQLIGQATSGDDTDQTLEKGEVPIQVKYDFNCNISAAKVKERGVDARVIIPGVSIYAPGAVMANKYNTAKMDVAKLFLDFVLEDEAQIAFAKFGARPIRAVLGDLELPVEARANWLPDADYAQVVQVENWPAIDAERIAALWEDDVLGG